MTLIIMMTLIITALTSCGKSDIAINDNETTMKLTPLTKVQSQYLGEDNDIHFYENTPYEKREDLDLVEEYSHYLNTKYTIEVDYVSSDDSKMTFKPANLLGDLSDFQVWKDNKTNEIKDNYILSYERDTYEVLIANIIDNYRGQGKYLIFGKLTDLSDDFDENSNLEGNCKGEVKIFISNLDVDNFRKLQESVTNELNSKKLYGHFMFISVTDEDLNNIDITNYTEYLSGTKCLAKAECHLEKEE